MRTPRWSRAAAWLVVLALALGPAAAAGRDAAVQPDVHFVPTPEGTVFEMLQMAGVGPGDIVYDLGSGDGRIVIAAVRDFGATRGVGVDIDPQRVAEGIANAEQAGVGDRVRFLQANIFEFDFSEATVVTLYLLPDLNLRLKPTLLAMRPGTRVVSHAFDMGDWRPDMRTQRSFFWVVPARVEGRWQWTVGGTVYRLGIAQAFQEVFGTLTVAGETTAVHDIGVHGDRLRFTAVLPRGAGGHAIRFDGRVTAADAIAAKVDIAGETRPVALTRGD
jgi:SAM-dependent methyltransferase